MISYICGSKEVDLIVMENRRLSEAGEGKGQGRIRRDWSIGTKL